MSKTEEAQAAKKEREKELADLAKEVKRTGRCSLAYHIAQNQAGRQSCQTCGRFFIP